MDRDDVARLMTLIIQEVRPRMYEEGFRPDSCVAATRIALDILTYFGVSDAQPFPVVLHAWNREGIELLKQHEGDMTAVAGVLMQIPVDAVGGPWNVGVGVEGGTTSAPDDPGAGHVIVGVPAHNLALDLTLDQASRPHKNMVLAPYLFDVTPGWWTDSSAVEFVRYPASVTEESEEWESVLIYMHASPRFLRSPNWRRSGSDRTIAASFKTITGQSIRAIRSRL